MKLSAAVLIASITVCCLAAPPIPPINKNKAQGDPGAPVMLEVFHDFTCSHCKVLHEQTMPLLIKDYVTNGKVYLVDRSFPLQGHLFTREAFNYAVAASRIGKYQAVADALFAKQAVWAVNGEYWKVVSAVLSPAEQKKVQDLVKDPGVAAEVEAEYQEGSAAAISSTPTLILTAKGKRVVLPPAPDYRFLKPMIDAYLPK